jgi:predicted nucleic acid-binding protein
MERSSLLTVAIDDRIAAQWITLGAQLEDIDDRTAIDLDALVAATAAPGNIDARVRGVAVDWCVRYGTAINTSRLQQVETDFQPLPFDADAARAFGRVAASLRRVGRETSARTYDAMIAAVAIAHQLPLYTCNPRDFQHIDGLEVVTVPMPTLEDADG